MNETQTLQDELSQYTGDMIRYRHTLNHSVAYTPGVRHLAEKTEAYWLIDAIASYVGSETLVKAIERDERLASLQFWKLDVHEDRSATLICEADNGEPPVVRQEIRYTDFPLEEFRIWVGFDGLYWVIYLPSEH